MEASRLRLESKPWQAELSMKGASLGVWSAAGHYAGPAAAPFHSDSYRAASLSAEAHAVEHWDGARAE